MEKSEKANRRLDRLFDLAEVKVNISGPTMTGKTTIINHIIEGVENRGVVRVVRGVETKPFGYIVREADAYIKVSIPDDYFKMIAIDVTTI
jgi:Ni2+-binding GTPase involved in maturation of urease and hydrogenase